jgi:hypothetical protein
MYSVYGKTDGQSFQGVVLGNDPVDAGLKARDMFDENGILDKNASVTVRGDGVITEIDQKVKGDYVRTDVTTRDLDGDKLASQRIKSFDNGVMESKFKGDLDDDGKQDTVTRVTGADGASVSYTKFGNGERAVSYTDAEGRTTEVTSQEMEENGLKHVNSQLKKAYKEIAEDIRENNTNAQMGGDAVSTVESTTQTVEGATSTVESATQTVENTTPAVENTADNDLKNASVLAQENQGVYDGGVHTTENNISYQFNENGEFHVEGTLSGVNTQAMLPAVTTFKNDSGSTVYQCGGSTALSSSMARAKEGMFLRNLVKHQEVYNDLQDRMSNGENLGIMEQKFMSHHEATLKGRGLEIKDGELVRAAPVKETENKELSNLFKRNRDGR